MTKAQLTWAFIYPKNNTKSVIDSLFKGAASFDLIWNNITFYWTRFWLMSALETGSGPIKSITFIHLYHDVLNANQSRIWPNLHWWFALMIYRDDLQVGFRQYVTFVIKRLPAVAERLVQDASFLLLCTNYKENK